MLLSLIVFSINTVNASSISQNVTVSGVGSSTNEIEEQLPPANKHSLDNLPDTLDVGIPSSKAVEDGFVSVQLFDIIEKKVKETTTDDITGLEPIIFFQGEFESKFSDISKISVSLFSNEIGLL